jgi:hypothetical protein
MTSSKRLTPLSENDRRELDKFEAYLRDRAARPNVPQFVVYGDHYGEVMFEDKVTG